MSCASTVEWRLQLSALEHFARNQNERNKKENEKANERHFNVTHSVGMSFIYSKYKLNTDNETYKYLHLPSSFLKKNVKKDSCAPQAHLRRAATERNDAKEIQNARIALQQWNISHDSWKMVSHHMSSSVKCVEWIEKMNVKCHRMHHRVMRMLQLIKRGKEKSEMCNEVDAKISHSIRLTLWAEKSKKRMRSMKIQSAKKATKWV